MKTPDIYNIKPEDIIGAWEMAVKNSINTPERREPIHGNKPIYYFYNENKFKITNKTGDSYGDWNLYSEIQDEKGIFFIVLNDQIKCQITSIKANEIVWIQGDWEYLLRKYPPVF